MTSVDSIAQAMREVAHVLQDGLDPQDLAFVIQGGLELADRCSELTGPEKREIAIRFVDEVLEEHLSSEHEALARWVAALDLPGPEWLEDCVWDPLLLQIVPGLIRQAVASMIPSVLDLVVSATRGLVAVNSPKEA